MPTATIEYGNAPGIFYSSEELNGNLILNLKQPLKIKKISLRIKGKAIVRWKEPSTSNIKENETSSDIWHSSTETYIDVYHDIFNEGGHAVTLNSGEHQFQFNYLLPPNLPATFNTSSGRVYYSSEALIQSDHRFSFSTSGKKVKKPFTVVPKLDFNSIPNANAMVTNHLRKTLYSCCWSLGFLKATLLIDRGAYLPGDKINISVDISNQSAVYLSHLEARLKRVVICKTDKNTKTDENIVISGTRCLKAISPHENFAWRNAQISIPPNSPPTDLGGCQIIGVIYYLKVDIRTHHTACLSSGITFKIPIIIGSPPSHMDIYNSNGLPDQLPCFSLPIIVSQPVNGNKDFLIKWHNGRNNKDETTLVTTK